MATALMGGGQDAAVQHMVLMTAHVLRAFMECGDATQRVVREMLDVLEDQDADADEKSMALATIQEALFPSNHNGEFGVDLEEFDAEESRSVEHREMRHRLDAEEATFAERLRDLMAARSLSQFALAEMVGVGQPAISMMLNRNCRPQRNTVQRIADALKVAPSELWPGFAE